MPSPTIASLLEGISDARDTIRSTLVTWGLAEATYKLSQLATAISQITFHGTKTETVQEGQTYSLGAGYISSLTVTGVAGGGNYTLETPAAVTPTKSQQSVSPSSGYYGLSSVTVNAIPAKYQDVSGVTATAADVLSPKKIVNSSGTVLTGSISTIAASNHTINGTTVDSYTIPAGYHNGSGTVSLDSTILDALSAI